MEVKGKGMMETWWVGMRTGADKLQTATLQGSNDSEMGMDMPLLLIGAGDSVLLHCLSLHSDLCY